jgi:hypothetical protein
MFLLLCSEGEMVDGVKRCKAEQLHWFVIAMWRLESSVKKETLSPRFFSFFGIKKRKPQMHLEPGRLHVTYPRNYLLTLTVLRPHDSTADVTALSNRTVER